MAVVLPGKFLYLANYHVASIATAKALYEQVEGVYRVGPHHAPVEGLAKVRQKGTVLPHERLNVCDVVLGSEVTFATVRHPYDWIVSCWLRNGPEMTLSEYICDLSDTSRGGYMRGGQVFWHRPKHLLRWEHLEGDLGEFLIRLGVPEVRLPLVNHTPGKGPWREHYDSSSRHAAEDVLGPVAHALGYDPSPW